MKAQIIERVELFSEAELESLEFVPEELEAIEAERVPDLESISFEDIAEDLEAYFEGDVEQEGLEARKSLKDIINRHRKTRPKWPNVDFNINKKKVTQLLTNTTSSSNKDLSRMANSLLNEMNSQNWQILAGGHSGGLGGQGRPADRNPHITLQVGRVTYHLRYVFKQGQMLLTHITR